MKEFLRRTPRYFTSSKRNDDQQIPEDLWTKCPGCGELIYTKQWTDNAKVCPKCGYHERLQAQEWVALLLDEGSWQEFDTELRPADPLHFVSPKDNYAAKLAALREQGMIDSSIDGTGTIDESPVALCVSEFAFIGGTLGSVTGEKIARAAERAAIAGMPLVTVNASGGARMHEGVVALMQMAKASVAIARLGRAGQPHIAILVDPCLGGVTASYASSADIILAEPGATIGFAGPRVIEQTVRQKVPPDFQKAEFVLAHGMIDMVTPRAELRGMLGRLTRLYRQRAGSVRMVEAAVGARGI